MNHFYHAKSPRVLNCSNELHELQIDLNTKTARQLPKKYFLEPAVEFLKRQAAILGFEFQVVNPVTPKKPVVILTWIGTQPELKSIVLNSHMDVVPVFEDFWTHKPFSADIDEEGRIFARGSQDMKCVGMQYLGALRYFKKQGIKFKRTIHCTFVPEEEVGGVHGMRDFVHQDKFKQLNVGFSLDEGEISFSFLHYEICLIAICNENHQ